MFSQRTLGLMNLAATIVCFIMLLIALFDSSVALRWVGFFLVFAIFNGIFAYLNLKQRQS